MDFSSMIFKPATIKVENILGQEVYNENMERVFERDKMLNTSKWPEGMYLISVECEQQLYSQKIIISR